MPNEITAQASLRCRNGDFNFNYSTGPIQIDQTTKGGGNPGSVTIGTAEEDISFGDVTPSMVIMQNLDATNYVEWGKKDGGGAMQAIGKLSPGGVALFEMNSATTLRMKSNTAACEVYIAALRA